MRILKKDIEEKFIRSRGKGGQNVNKVATCVQLKHIPTGVSVKCDKYRTQAKNREEAYRLLEEKIEQKEKSLIRKQIAEKEKSRRQKRKRPKALKEKILEEKKKNSEKKRLRRSLLR